MENIKWYGDKKDFLNFAKDYVINIHDRCRNPKNKKDLQLIKDLKDVEIQIVGTVNGEDILEIRFVDINPNKIQSPKDWLTNHKELSIYDVAEYDEGGYLGVNEQSLYKIMADYSQYHITKQQEIHSKDKQHLEWIYNRLVEIHNENPNVDYMLKLKKIIS